MRQRRSPNPNSDDFCGPFALPLNSLSVISAAAPERSREISIRGDVLMMEISRQMVARNDGEYSWLMRGIEEREQAIEFLLERIQALHQCTFSGRFGKMFHVVSDWP